MGKVGSASFGVLPAVSPPLATGAGKPGRDLFFLKTCYILG